MTSEVEIFLTVWVDMKLHRLKAVAMLTWFALDAAILKLLAWGLRNCNIEGRIGIDDILLNVLICLK